MMAQAWKHAGEKDRVRNVLHLGEAAAAAPELVRRARADRRACHPGLQRAQTNFSSTEFSHAQQFTLLHRKKTIRPQIPPPTPLAPEAPLLVKSTAAPSSPTGPQRRLAHPSTSSLPRTQTELNWIVLRALGTMLPRRRSGAGGGGDSPAVVFGFLRNQFAKTLSREQGLVVKRSMGCGWRQTERRAKDRDAHLAALQGSDRVPVSEPRVERGIDLRDVCCSIPRPPIHPHAKGVHSSRCDRA